jgi:hypothetical protein
MSLSTMKIERHNPGGLLWWEDLLELGINLAILFGTIYVSLRIDPVFGVLWTLLCVLIAGPVAAFAGLKLRFKFFERRPSSVTVRYEPANIPTELIDRYEKAKTDLLQANIELEQIAAESGVEYCHALKEWGNQ